MISANKPSLAIIDVKEGNRCNNFLCFLSYNSLFLHCLCYLQFFRKQLLCILSEIFVLISCLSLSFPQVGLLNLENEEFVKKVVENCQNNLQVSNSLSGWL